MFSKCVFHIEVLICPRVFRAAFLFSGALLKERLKAKHKRF